MNINRSENLVCPHFIYIHNQSFLFYYRLSHFLHHFIVNLQSFVHFYSYFIVISQSFRVFLQSFLVMLCVFMSNYALFQLLFVLLQSCYGLKYTILQSFYALVQDASYQRSDRVCASEFIYTKRQIGTNMPSTNEMRDSHACTL